MENRSGIEWNTYLACAYAEGFCEGEDATPIQKIEAWAYLIRMKLAWQLQGGYGRMASNLIATGIISNTGEIDWDEFENQNIFE